MDIKLVITDIDGVWTDGGMYYSTSGEESKKFSVYDGVGVKVLYDANIPVVIMTGEKNSIIDNRAKKLKIERVYQHAADKLSLAKELVAELGIRLEQVAFIGDEFNDISLLEKVGFSACPNQASDYVQNKVDLVLEKKGGEGAFKEFAFAVLNKIGRTDLVPK